MCSWQLRCSNPKSFHAMVSRGCGRVVGFVGFCSGMAMTRLSWDRNTATVYTETAKGVLDLPSTILAFRRLQLLMTHPGVGPVTALALVLIVGYPERFPMWKTD